MTIKMKIPLSEADDRLLESLRPTDWDKGMFAAVLIASTPPEASSFVRPGRRQSFTFPEGMLPDVPSPDKLELGAWYGNRLHSALSFYGSAPEPTNGRFGTWTPISLPIPLVRAWAFRAIRERRRIDALASEWVDRALRTVDRHLSNGLALPIRTYTISVDPALFAKVQSKVFELNLHFPTLLRFFLSQEHP